MDRLDELLVLTTILDAGSLAAAARRLRRSPPAMTRSLADLEARVGSRLVQRTTRRLTATAAGRRVASCARQLLAGARCPPRRCLASDCTVPVRPLAHCPARVEFSRCASGRPR